MPETLTLAQAAAVIAGAAYLIGRFVWRDMQSRNGNDPGSVLATAVNKIATDLSNYEIHGADWRERVATQLHDLTVAQATVAMALGSLSTAMAVLMERTARTRK